VFSLTNALSLVPASYASSQTVTFLLDASPPTNVNCNEEAYNLLLSPASPSSSFAALGVFDFCTPTVYTGPALSVTSVTVTLYGFYYKCGTGCQVSGSMTDRGTTGSCTSCGTIYQFPTQPASFSSISNVAGCSASTVSSITISPSGSFGSLTPGDYLLAHFSFANSAGQSGLAETPYICTGGSTPSQIVITGNTSVGVPQFPFGMILVLGIGFPMIALLRVVSKRTSRIC
jgi:hypothetical protein